MDAFLAMVLLFLRVATILVVSHEMSTVLKAWKDRFFILVGTLVFSFFFGGILGTLLALFFWYLLHRKGLEGKNPFLFTFLPWVFVEVITKILQLFLFPWFFQISYDTVKETLPLVILSYLIVYPIFHLLTEVFFLDFNAFNDVETNPVFRIRQRYLVGLTLLYIIITVTTFYTSTLFDYTDLLTYFAAGVTLIYAILFTFLFVQLNKYSKRQTKQELMAEMHRHEESLEEYSHKLEELYNDISQVKQDYLVSLKNMETSIKRHNLATLKRQYQELLDKSGSNLSLTNYELSRLVNLEISPLKSLFSAKILEAEDLGIQVSLELPDVITKTRIDHLDLVVISSVFLDNAIEAAIQAPHPTVSLSFFKHQDNLTLIVDNATKEKCVPISKIFSEGVSSKGDGRGLGLSKVEEILRRYPMAHLETKSRDYHFTQVLTF